ncbi:serine/threonine protein kinase, partial [Rhizobium ruizarguesonis]
GIVHQDHVPQAVMHYAVLPGSASGENRVPPEGEIVSLATGFSLPALRLLTGVSSPLAILMAKVPDIGR